MTGQIQRSDESNHGRGTGITLHKPNLIPTDQDTGQTLYSFEPYSNACRSAVAEISRQVTKLASRNPVV